MFGAPNYIFSSNEREFTGEYFYEMCEKFNIKVSSTPSYSLWSNGICKRHNQVITNMLLKISENVTCSFDVALAWEMVLALHKLYSQKVPIYQKY